MGVTIATTRAALNTSTGNQDFDTSDLGGLTPKLALFIVTRGVTDGTAADTALLSFGMADGSEQQLVYMDSITAQATSDTGMSNHADRAITTYDNAGSVDGYATFGSFHTNGVRVSVDDAFPSGYLCTVVLFAGTDLSVDVHNVNLTNAIDTAHDVTAPGFEPDLLIPYTANVGVGVGIGFVHNNRSGTVTQKCATIRLRNGRTTTESYSKQYSDRGSFVQAGAWASDNACTLEFSGFDSSGYTVTTRQAAPGSATMLKCAALRFGSSPVVSSKVWAYATPTGTGNATDTTPGFQPQFVMYLPTLNAAVDTYYSDASAGALGVSVITPTAQYCNSIADQDNVSGSNTQSLSDNQAVNLPLDDGSAGMAATYVSMQSTGPQLNWSDVETTARYYIGMAIQAEAGAAALSINIDPATYGASGWADGVRLWP